MQKDVEISKINSYLKEKLQKDKVISVLQKHYLLIKNIYRYLSSLHAGTSQQSITPNVLTDFLNRCGILSKAGGFL